MSNRSLLALAFLVAACGPSQVCAPGSSVACVGPGGCAGGQMCLADGSGFSVCDCGGTDAGTDAGRDAGAAADAPTDSRAADAPVSCDPVAGSGCSGTDRCAWARSGGAGAPVCAPQGTAAAGMPCTIDTEGVDDCVAGAVCIADTCARICGFGGGPTCASTESCVAYEGLFDTSGTRLGGACVTSCDPLTQLRPDGTDCGVGRACYMVHSPSGTFFACAGVGALTHGDVITGPAFANSCAAGHAPQLDAAGVSVCRALCRPVETSTASPGGAAGEAPFACPADGSECVFGWSLAMSDPPDPRLNDVGICFDRSGRMYDDGDGTPEIAWPSCTTRSPTDGADPDDVAEHREIACAPF